jgi:hydrogenase expression/formation protein HypC
MVPEAQVGDYVIVHVGFAISRLDEAAARRSLELYRAMAEGQARKNEGQADP